MSCRNLASTLAVVAALVVPALAAAETIHFPIDAVHSGVNFKIRHLVARTTGGFDAFSGSVWADPEDVAGTLRIEGTIGTTSVNTKNERRDNHLRNADFFDVENHPKITFVSTSVKADGDDFLVSGDLTLRGVTKPITLAAELGGFVTHPFSGMPSMGIELAGEINRKDFGMVWNKDLDTGGLMLGETVKLSIQLEATVPAEDE